MNIHRCTCLDMHKLFLERHARGWCCCCLCRPDWHLLEEKQLVTVLPVNQVLLFPSVRGDLGLLVLFCLGRQILTVTKPNGGAIQFLCPPRVSHNFWFTSRLNTNEERSRGAGCLAANVTGDVASASLSSTTSSSRPCPPLLSLVAGSPARNWGWEEMPSLPFHF